MTASLNATVIDEIAPHVATYVLPSGRHYWWECDRQECLDADRNCAPIKPLGSKGAATRQAREHVVDWHRTDPAKVASLVASLTPTPPAGGHDLMTGAPVERRVEPDPATLGHLEDLHPQTDPWDRGYMAGARNGTSNAIATLLGHAVVELQNTRRGARYAGLAPENYQGGYRALMEALVRIGGWDLTYWTARVEESRAAFYTDED